MIVLNKLVYFIYKFCRIVGAVVMAVIVLSVTAGIISRYIFNRPFNWTEEVTVFMMVHLCYFAAVLTTVEKKHIVADFLIAKAPENFKAFVAFASKILEIAFFIVITISVIQILPKLTWVSSSLHIKRQFYYLPVIFSAVSMMIAVVTDILNSYFPGYNYIGEFLKREKEEAAEEERLEAAALQKNIDEFLEATESKEVNESGVSIESTESNKSGDTTESDGSAETADPADAVCGADGTETAYAADGAETTAQEGE